MDKMPRTSALIFLGVLLAPLELEAQDFPPVSPLWPQASYRDTLWITPNGAPNEVAPMVLHFLGAPQRYPFAPPQSGHYAKVGISAMMFYTRVTAGGLQGADYEFSIYGGPSATFMTLPLPPDVTSISQLPLLVRNHLPSWATIDACPYLIASLEWARYYDLPLAVLADGTGPQAGHDGAFEPYDLDRLIESRSRNSLVWDVSDKATPNDPAQSNSPAPPFEDSGLGYDTASYQTPSFADPATTGISSEYQDKLRRNLITGLTQLIELAQVQRYLDDEGKMRLVAFGIDPELHYPTPESLASPLPNYPSQITYSGPTIFRPLAGDYNPAMIQQFQLWLQQRYKDANPMDDSNGDLVTFNGDFGAAYQASGSPSHLHAQPTLWSDVDPPRDRFVAPGTPYTGGPWTVPPENPVVGPYWQLWCNFRVDALKLFVDRIVGWAREAGVPSDRIFTHQTGANASYNSNRLAAGKLEWMDDFGQMTASHGRSGASFYQPFNAIDGFALYSNLAQRDDAWGSPEFNPFYNEPPTPLTQQQTDNVIGGAWSNSAQVLWPQFLGISTIPVLDYSSPLLWSRDTSSPSHISNWTPVNLQAAGNVLVVPASTSGGAFLESPIISLDPVARPFLVVTMGTFFGQNPPPGLVRTCVVEFRVGQDPVYKRYEALQSDARVLDTRYHDITIVIDMRKCPDWVAASGQLVTQLRIFPVGNNTEFVAQDGVHMQWIAVPGATDFSRALKALTTAKRDLPRPPLPATWTPALPFHLGNNVASLYSNQQLNVFGANPTGSPVPTEFLDFAPANNFYQSSCSSGNTTMACIVAPAPVNRMGLRKTGRFRRIQLPTTPGLVLATRVGIQDGSQPNPGSLADGALFRVVLRDAELGEHVLIEQEWRWNRWSQPLSADLSPFGGQVVDISFETQALAPGNGGVALWGDPVIAQATTTSFESQKNNDGYVVESTSSSGVGGTWQAKTTSLLIGDDSSARQLIGVVSFDTVSTLAGKTILAVQLRLTQSGTVGSPSTLGHLHGRPPLPHGRLGNSAALELVDFQWPADNAAVLTVPAGSPNLWVGSFAVEALSFTDVNQFRLEFAQGDNGDATVDQLQLFSSDATTQANRPVLLVTYF